MSRTLPFRPFANAAQRKNVGSSVKSFALPDHPNGICVQIDNRGTTDIMIEIGETTPTDATSFPIAGGMSQIIYVGDKRNIKVKRAAGSDSGEVIVTAGQGN